MIVVLWFDAEVIFHDSSVHIVQHYKLEARSRGVGLRGDGDHVLVELGQGAQRLARVDVEVVVLVHEARVPEQRHGPRRWPPGADAAAHPAPHVMTVLHVTSCHVITRTVM